jgi:hypothetical protein
MLPRLPSRIASELWARGLQGSTSMRRRLRLGRARLSKRSRPTGRPFRLNRHQFVPRRTLRRRLLIQGAVRDVCLGEGKSLLADATPRTFPAARSSDQSRSRARPLGAANKGLVPNDAPSPGEASVRLPMRSDCLWPRLQAVDRYPFLPFPGQKLYPRPTRRVWKVGCRLTIAAFDTGACTLQPGQNAV